jgi:hypothetical protein
MERLAGIRTGLPLVFLNEFGRELDLLVKFARDVKNNFKNLAKNVFNVLPTCA